MSKVKIYSREFYYDDSDGDFYELSPDGTYQKTHSNGAAFTLSGIAVKATHRREINTLVGTEETLDWSGTPIHGVIFMAVQEAAGTAELRASVAYCIDPPSDAVRDAWLTAGDALSTDTERDVFPINSEEEVYFGGATVTKIGVKREFGSENIRLIAIGIEGH